VKRELRKFLIIIGIFLAIVTLKGTLFTVGEWERAIVIEFGKPVRSINDPGLEVKIPFIQTVLKFEKRLLEYDAAPKELLTQDKQQIIVDNYSRWRIIDPLLFYQTLRNEAGAQSRLDDIMYSDLRENLGRHTKQEIVSTKRAEIMQEILAKSKKKALEYGIELADLRIKRVDLPEKNEQNVFERMRTERERMAKKFRAEGEEEARKITSEADRQEKVILAVAGKDADIIRGEGEARAANIYAKAYNQDPDFYSFQRTLESYDISLQEGTTLVLSPDSEYFRYLKSQKGVSVR